jgi:K+-transporting ATPase KdpF subunit
MRTFASDSASSRKRKEIFTMENLIIGLIAAGLLVYLIVAVLCPEKF